jgi:hypothetical protein
MDLIQLLQAVGVEGGVSGVLVLAIYHLYKKQNKNHQECIEDRKKLWGKYKEQYKEIVNLKSKQSLPCEKDDCPRK